jgi:hypothetical protein
MAPQFLTLEFWTDETNKNQLRALFLFLSESFSVCMACELFLFVPQHCFTDADETGHLCTLEEQIRSTKPVDMMLLGLNTVTLGITVAMYLFEMMRDLWLMEHFSFNSNQSETSIERFRSSQRSLFMRLEMYNWIYFLFYKLVVGLYTVNFVVSSVFICQNAYSGVQTVTAILSYGLSYFQKLLSGWLVASKAAALNIPLSYYSVQHLSYNEIDGTYKIDVRSAARPTRNRLQSIITLATSHTSISEAEVAARRSSRIMYEDNDGTLRKRSRGEGGFFKGVGGDGTRPPLLVSPVTRGMTLFPFMRPSTKNGAANVYDDPVETLVGVLHPPSKPEEPQSEEVVSSLDPEEKGEESVSSLPLTPPSSSPPPLSRTERLRHTPIKPVEV